jgi:MscS family membrane protein
MHVFDRLGGIVRWESLAVVVWAVGSAAVGVLLGLLSRRVLVRLAGMTESRWDDRVVGRLRGPLSLGWAVLAAYVGLAWLDLTGAAEATTRAVLRGAFIATLFWMLLRAVDVAGEIAGASAWARARPASRSFIGLGGRTVKIAVVIVGAITILSQAGFQVGSIIAGLGIGGLALALGAQKTLENVFGAFSIAIDEPFHEGDFVKIEDVVGTVESIGLRSTRVRTLDRTLVVIPNGKLAEMRTESFAARDRLRLACTIGLVYDTTPEQMRAVLAGLQAALRAHAKIWPDAVVVRYKELAASSLDIEVMAWFQTQDWGEFQAIREELLLAFMEVVASAGTSFAFPTRTVHLVGETPRSGRP